MNATTELKCNCGNARIEVNGEPFLVTECMCDSCRLAASRLASLPNAKSLLTPLGGTSTAMYRKDRVQISHGSSALSEFRHTADSGTRRVVATCCNTPMFMELKGAHWLDIYLHLWPEADRPTPEVRTMVSDLRDASQLPNDIPNLKSQSASLYAKLLWAWILMGFRNPKIEVAEKLHV